MSYEKSAHKLSKSYSEQWGPNNSFDFDIDIQSHSEVRVIFWMGTPISDTEIDKSGKFYVQRYLEGNFQI